MSNVFVDKNKIDLLANAISAKSGESLTLTLDEMVEAVDGIESGGGGVTPTGNINITQAGVTDVTNYATATVPQGEVYVSGGHDFFTSAGVRKWQYTPNAQVYLDDSLGAEGFIADGYEEYGGQQTFNAVPKNTTITPSTSSQTIGGANYMMEGAVTVSAMPSGTAGTPTATKGAVSNHSVSVTPSVTNTTGYITGSTKTGTAVSVSASELVSGSETKTANGTYDVTNLASLVVNVSGGGGSGLTLLESTSLGTLSTTSTNASDTGKTMTVTGYNDYDLLVVDVSVDTPTNGRHTSTVSMILLTGTSNVDTKNTYTVMSNKWNSRLGSTGTGSTRTTTTSAYGVYVYTASVSNSTMTLSFYYRYNSNNTGTLNGTYTARVYGVKLYDLIGG